LIELIGGFWQKSGGCWNNVVGKVGHKSQKEGTYNAPFKEFSTMAQTAVLVMSVTSGSSICVAFRCLPTDGWTSDGQGISERLCDRTIADGLEGKRDATLVDADLAEIAKEMILKLIFSHLFTESIFFKVRRTYSLPGVKVRL
jgi:hypothetical protein